MSFVHSTNTLRKPDRFSAGGKNTYRTQLSTNLRKLVDVMDIDLLSTSLGLRESVLRDILSGRDNGDSYRQFIEQKLDEAGFASRWLDRANAQVFPDQISELKQLASVSTQKAPLRRNNLKTLLLAFDGKLDTLADALEVVPESLLKVADGALVLDDQRFGHFNPKLVEAGFPDCWLDLPQAKVDESWAQGLEKMAADQYEAYLSANDPPAVAYTIAAEPAATAQISAAGPEEEIHVLPPTPTVISTLTTANVMSTPPIPATLKPAATPKASIVGAIFGSKKTADFLEKKATKAVSPTQIALPLTPEPQEMPVATAAPGQAIQLKGAPPPAVAKAFSKDPAATVNSASIQASQAAHAAKVAAPVPAPTSGPVARAGMPTKNEVKVQAQATSLLRAQRLEELMLHTRRGLRTFIWNDILSKSLPHFYNIKAGKAAFTDEMQAGITQALGLPAGWLDDPKGDVTVGGSWIYSKDMPLGGAPGQAATSKTMDTVKADQVKMPDLSKLPAPSAVPIAQGKIISQLKPEKTAPIKVAGQAPVSKKAQIAAPSAPIRAAEAPVVVAAPVAVAPAIVAAAAQTPVAPTPSPATTPAASVKAAPAVVQAEREEPVPVSALKAATPVATVAVAPQPAVAAPKEVLQPTTQAAVVEPAPSNPVVEAAPKRGTLGSLGPIVCALLDTIELHARQGTLSEQSALDLICRLNLSKR